MRTHRRIPIRQRHFIASSCCAIHRTRSLSLAELRELFARCGLVTPQPVLYELHVGLEELLARAFSDPGDLAEIRATFTAAAEDDRLGIPVRRDGDRIDIAYRAAIRVAERPAP